MNDSTRTALHDLITQARPELLNAVGELLEGTYGLLPGGTFQPESGYPALCELPEAAETRRRLEKFLADETAAGLGPAEAREKLLKEVAFTWLNRFVAFKMLEARKLIKPTLAKGPDSNGFKLWLIEPGNEDAHEFYKAGDLPPDALGEGPRQRAYRRFLLAQCTRLTAEIRVLFDPDNLPSRLLPPPVLAPLLVRINDPKVDEAWQSGNEDTIGWVYQYFNEEEKKEVFDRLYKKKLNPAGFPGMSPFMAAVVGHVLDEFFTDPQIAEITVGERENVVYFRQTGDIGFDDIESLADLGSNWNRLIDAAGLSPEERRQAVELFRARVSSVPGTGLG